MPKQFACTCKDWPEQIKKVNEPILYLFARNPDTYRYTGKPFIYCPWCGMVLDEIEIEEIKVRVVQDK